MMMVKLINNKYFLLFVLLLLSWKCDSGKITNNREEQDYVIQDSIMLNLVDSQAYSFNGVSKFFNDSVEYSNKIKYFLLKESLEISELLKCVMSIYSKCEIKQAISLDSLIKSLCRFVPYGLTISTAKKFSDENALMIYYFTCWDSSDLLSDFILLPIDSKYCDTMTKRFSLAWDLDDSNEVAFKDMFSEDTLRKDGIGYVIVHIVNNLEFVGNRVIDIDYDITVRDTVDITLLYVNLNQRRGFVCVDSNVIIDKYHGFIKISDTCYVKYPHACLWK